MAFVFVSVLLASWQLSYVPAFLPRVCVTVLGLLQGNFKYPRVSGLLLQFMSAHLLVLVVLQCIVFEASCSLCSVLVFFSPSSSPLIIFSSSIIVVISPLNSRFSVMGAWAGAGCGGRGSW